MLRVPNYILENLNFLKGLSKVKGAGARKWAIRDATDPQILTIISILLNFYLGNIEINQQERKKVCVHRDTLSSILSKTTGLEEKRKELIDAANLVVDLVAIFLRYE